MHRHINLFPSPSLSCGSSATWIFIIFWLSSLFVKIRLLMTLNRLLGTPNEEIWPGVSTLPDYKPTFPKWAAADLSQHVPYLDDDGLDFLYVCIIFFFSLSRPAVLLSGWLTLCFLIDSNRFILSANFYRAYAEYPHLWYCSSIIRLDLILLHKVLSEERRADWSFFCFVAKRALVHPYLKDYELWRYDRLIHSSRLKDLSCWCSHFLHATLLRIRPPFAIWLFIVRLLYMLFSVISSR